MRKFKLIKGTGESAEEYNLQSFDHFLNVPTGLGFDIEYNVLRSGESFVTADQHQSQKQIDGEMVFSSYQKYVEFIDFIGDNENLTLAYAPDDDWSYIPVKVASLSKGEIETNRALICAVTFLAFGTWYNVLKFTGSQSYTINNTSKFPAPFRLKVRAQGPLNYVYWQATSATGAERYGSGSVSDAIHPIQSGQVFVVSSVPEDLQISVYNYDGGDRIRNMYQQSNSDLERFFNLPTGISIFNCSNNCELEVIQYAYSV